MSKVLKVGGVTPSGVASGLRLTENGMLPIYSPQKDFFIGSVVEPVPHGHVGARGVFGLKCRAKTALHNAYNGGLVNAPIITDYGVVVSGMNRLQAFDGNLNPLWDVAFPQNQMGFSRSVNKGGVVVARGFAVVGHNVELSEFDRSGSLVAKKTIDNVDADDARDMQVLDGYYFLLSYKSGVATISKLNASLDVVWQKGYSLNDRARGLLQFGGALYLLETQPDSTQPSVQVIDPDNGSVLKKWKAPDRVEAGFFWDGHLYCITYSHSLIRIKLDADEGETFETVIGSTGVNQPIWTLAADNNGHFFAASGTGNAADKRFYKINAEGVIELEVRYQDSLGSHIQQLAYHNGSVIACTLNELMVLSEDLQLKGYTLS